MRTRLAIISALLLVPCIVAATRAAILRPRPTIDYVPASDFAERSEYAARTKTIGGTVAMAPDEQTVYMLVRRTKESDIEEHSRWDDILLVRSGMGAIEFSAKTRGARVIAPGRCAVGSSSVWSRECYIRATWRGFPRGWRTGSCRPEVSRGSCLS